jgi:GntR family transcriptional regulator
MNALSLVEVVGRLEEGAALPLYQQLQRGLRRAIEKNILAPDQALPPERDLAHDFAVSRITIRKALEGLVEERLLVRRQGSGTFVAGRVEKNFAKLTSFTEDMISRGRSPANKWLKKARGTVTPDESITIGLPPGTPIYRFHRLRYADGAPMALEFCIVQEFCLPSVSDVGDSLYAALKSHGHRPTRALQRLRAVRFNQVQAEMLKAEPGDPGLLVERRGFLGDGRAIEFSYSYYRGDTYDFVAELTLQEAGE